MSISLSELRRAEAVTVAAQLSTQNGVVEDGDVAGLSSNHNFAVAPGGVGTITVEQIDETSATVTGGSTSGSVAVLYTLDDNTGGQVSANLPGAVLDYDHYALSFFDPSDLTVERALDGTVLLTPTSAVEARVSVEAQLVDVRVGTGGPAPSPAYSADSIGWTSANGRVLLDTGSGAGTTASGTLTLDLVVDDVGDDIITVESVNSLGATVSQAFQFRVIGVTSATLAVAG